MKLRLGVLAIVVSLLLIGSIAIRLANDASVTNSTKGAPLGQSGEEVRTPTADQKDPLESAPSGIEVEGIRNAWTREGHYLTMDNSGRWTEPPTHLTTNTQETQSTNPQSVKILVVGDSFTYGVGHTDPHARWPELLQDELDSRTAPHVFEVIRMSRPGTSAFNHAAWLHENAAIAQQADLIVIGVVENDGVPNDGVTPLCTKGQDQVEDDCQIPVVENHPLYLACMHGVPRDALGSIAANVAPGVVARLLSGTCEAPRFAEELGLPSAYAASSDLPNSELAGQFSDAVDAMRKAAAGTPIIAAPLEMWRARPFLIPGFGTEDRGACCVTHQGFTTDDNVLAQDIVDAYEHYGIEGIEMPETLRVLSGPWHPDLEVNPGDAHPGSMLTKAYARDIADVVLERIPAARIEQGAALGPHERTQLLTGFLPAEMQVDQGPDTAVINVTGEEGAVNITRVGPFVLNGVETKYQQFAPCMSLGRPHARLYLDHAIPDGSTVTITLDEGASVDVFTSEYNADNQQVVRSVGALDRGGSLAVTVSGPQPVRAILIAPREHNGCPLEELIRLNPMRITLERQDRSS